MDTRIFMTVVLLAIGIGAKGATTVMGTCDEDVRAVFADPPESARIQMWYHWVNDCVTREGLVRDFKAFGELGVDIVHVISPSMAILPKKPAMMSPEWLDLFAFAIGEAKKKNVRISFHNCPGWSSSGGPWITPENSMKVVVSSEVDVRSGDMKVRLPQPLTVKGFYRDIAVYAFPLERPAFKALKNPVLLALKDEGSEQSVTFEHEEALAPTQVVMTFSETSFHADCAIEASADGRSWSPVGEARFRFFGAPATPKIVGLRNLPAEARFFRVTFRHAPPLPWVPACDVHLQALEFNGIPMIPSIEAYNSATSAYGYHPELERLGRGLDPDSIVDLSSSLSPDGTLDLRGLPRTGDFRIVRIGYTSRGNGPGPATIAGLECDKLDRKGIEAHWRGMPAKILALPGARGTVVETYIDSYEVGGQNWSECMAREYCKRRGSDIGKNLLTICGYPVGDGARAARFLWDFQRTVGELFAENYYDRFGELCRDNGIRAAGQTYGGPYDPMRSARNMDEPQGEFWMSGRDCGNSTRLMSSVSHLNGKRITSAECFTSDQANGRWLCTPHWFRTIGDRYGWLNGINAFVCHSYCHQPFTNVIPGISLGRHGSQFNVNTTWWRDAWAWRNYVRRGQALLQYGEPRAEVLILGPGAPESLLAAGYNHDLCSEYDIASLEARPDGVGKPGRPSYRMLVVHPSVDGRLMDSTRKKLDSLSAAGVRVVVDDPLLAVRKARLRAPFEDPSQTLRAIRREGPAGETIWFVVNTSKEPFAGEVTFWAMQGTRPEFFDAKTGLIAAAESVTTERDRFKVKLDLQAEGSSFVVFTRDATKFVPVKQSKGKTVDVSTGWRITSFEGRAAPLTPLDLPHLVDWSQSNDPKLKYFSGRAVYEKTIKGVSGVITLDLGEVHEIANVYVDGKFVACLWERPYRTTVNHKGSEALRLRIEVVNLLPNRMIGDAIAIRNGAKEVMSGSWPEWVLENRMDSGTGIYSWSNFRQAWTADDKPLPSGLLGPVRLLVNPAGDGR